MKHKPWISQKGATAIEFAIVFPILILLIFGMIEFGLYLFNKHVITNAAREGTRFGIVSRPVRWENADIIQKVLDYSEKHLVTFGSTNSPTVTLKPIDLDIKDPNDPSFDSENFRCVVFGCDLEVQVGFPYNFFFFKMFNPDPPDKPNIISVAVMKME